MPRVEEEAEKRGRGARGKEGYGKGITLVPGLRRSDSISPVRGVQFGRCGRARRAPLNQQRKRRNNYGP
jgi:hypothetical protein